MSKPHKTEEHALGFDQYGVGMLSDGTLATFTPEQARQRIAERDADEGGDDFDISDLDELDKLFTKKTKDVKASTTTTRAFQLARKLDKLGFLRGFKKVILVPDHDKWNASYENKNDTMELRLKFERKPLKEKVQILLHEAGHRGQFKRPELFKAFKDAGLGTHEQFYAMANEVHKKDYHKNGIENPVEEAFAESYSRYVMGMPLPESIRAFWRARIKRFSK